tara:strand:- start:504 stop:773 length:270 start_codon:yes stop_codon:yes gene_type:complete
MMKKLLLLLSISILNINPSIGEQNLLQRVKNNPNEAIKLCSKLREFNSKGISASDEKAIKHVAAKKGFNPTNAEIYSIYAIGLHCPEVI